MESFCLTYFTKFMVILVLVILWNQKTDVWLNQGLPGHDTTKDLEVTSIQNSPWSQENSKQAIYAEVLPSIDTYNLPYQPQTRPSASQVGTRSRAPRLSPNQAQTAPSGEKAPEQMKPLPEVFLMPWVISIKKHVPTCGIKLGAQVWHKHDLSQ